MLEHHIQSPSGTKYNAFFVQTRSLHVWTCSLHSLVAFNRCIKHVRTRSQTRWNEKPNAFERVAKHVWTRSQTRSNEKLTAFVQSLKRARTKLQTPCYIIRNSFKTIHWQCWLMINSLFTYMNKFTYMNRELFCLTQGVQITEDVLYFRSEGTEIFSAEESNPLVCVLYRVIANKDTKPEAMAQHIYGFCSCDVKIGVV